METATIVLVIIAAFCGHQWWTWRKAAMHYRALINSVENNVKPAQDMINALADERRLQHTAMMEVFDCLNELPANPDRWPVEQIKQSRNILLHAIQNSTYREGEHGTGT